MAGYKQEDHLLRIDTDLNNDADEKTFEGDPLLLVKLDGVEGISRLYAYDVIMLRDAGGDEGARVNGKKRPPFDPTKLIGTHAVIGARPSTTAGEKEEQGQDIFFKRVGMFEAFEDIVTLDIVGLKPLIKVGPTINKRDFHIYRARVVPWVKVLSRDVCYRVFENNTVVQIIEDIAAEAKKTFPHLLIDTSGLAKPPAPFAPMDYCVQFGESTLDFLSRLMARFGIWYYFGHVASGDSFVLNETMFLKGNWDHDVPVAGMGDVNVKDKDAGVREIGKLVRRFRPPERRVAVGGFNYLDPTHPFYKAGAVTSEDDLLKKEGGEPLQTKFLGSTSFAQPVFSNSDANALDSVARSQNQAEVFLLSGINKNQTFLPGHSFHVEKDKKFDPSDNEQAPLIPIIDKKFVIDVISISGNDYRYLNLSVAKPLDFIVDSLLHTVHALGADADGTDDSNNSLYKVSLWAKATGEAMIYGAINPLGGNFADTASGLAMDLAGAASSLSGPLSLIPGVGSALSSVLSAPDLKGAAINAANLATFAVGVIAVPADPPPDMPLPISVRPVARGPHTAMVIGPKGVDTTEHDIFCDAIGRVRVRFPWDPGPPQGDSKIPPAFPFTQTDKPTKVGEKTCWVRVVEGWGGRHYGTQFLPRIGQEVLIDFLDGDPERPIITGRVYNADRGPSNLPFPDSSLKDTQLKDLANLPATQRFDLPLSGIKTASIPTTGGDGNPLPTRFNLMRFSDKRGSEQYLFRAQHRLDITAFERRYESIGSDRHLTVGGKKITPPPKEIGGDYIGKVYRHYYLHVGDPDFPTQSGNRSTKIEQNDYIHVIKNMGQQVDGNWSVTTGGQATIDANGMESGGNIVLNATMNITLKCGASTIVMTPSTIAITSPMVLINSGGPPPIPPIDAAAIPLVEPIAADPGNSLTPPD